MELNTLGSCPKGEPALLVKQVGTSFVEVVAGKRSPPCKRLGRLPYPRLKELLSQAVELVLGVQAIRPGSSHGITEEAPPLQLC